MYLVLILRSLLIVYDNKYDIIPDMPLLDELDALLITNPTNIRYLTGFVGAAPEEREAYYLIAQESIFLFTNALYLEQSKNLKSQVPNLKQIPIQVIKISSEEPFAKKLAELLTGSRPVSRLGFEEANLTVVEYEKLKKELPGITLVPTQNRIDVLRMIKRDDEIENIRAAAKITDACFDYILGKIKPASRRQGSASRGGTGVTESEIAWEIESFIRGRGAQLAFSPIVAFGAHTSQPHYNPQSKPSVQPLQNPSLKSASCGPKSNQSLALKSQDIILLDFGARVNGYCSDMTRVVFIGKPEAQWIKAYETVLQAQAAALQYLASRPGLEAKSGKTDRVAREVIENAGFPTYPHSLGHGLGLDIHESPRLRASPSTNSKKSVASGPSEKLKAGMVVTVEPGIYLEGQYGIRIEDLILLNEDGIEVLSKSDKQVMIL